MWTVWLPNSHTLPKWFLLFSAWVCLHILARTWIHSTHFCTSMSQIQLKLNLGQLRHEETVNEWHLPTTYFLSNNLALCCGGRNNMHCFVLSSIHNHLHLNFGGIENKKHCNSIALIVQQFRFCLLFASRAVSLSSNESSLTPNLYIDVSDSSSVGNIQIFWTGRVNCIVFLT